VWKGLSHSKNKIHVLGNAISVLGVKSKRGCYVFRLYFKIGLCSAMSFKSFRRELSIDVAQHRSMLKHYQNTHYFRFTFNTYCVLWRKKIAILLKSFSVSVGSKTEASKLPTLLRANSSAFSRVRSASAVCPVSRLSSYIHSHFVLHDDAVPVLM